MSKRMIQQSIRVDEKIFKIAEKEAAKQNRSKNFILQKWLIDGMNLNLENKYAESKNA